MPFNFSRRKNPIEHIGERDGRFFAESRLKLFTILKGDVIMSTEDGSSSLPLADIHYFLIDRRLGSYESSLFIEYSKNGRTMKIEVGEVTDEIKKDVVQWVGEVNKRYYHSKT